MNNLLLGVMAALGAGLLWGSAFVVPLLLPDYPPALLTFGRYAAFGIVTVPIAWWQKSALITLTRQDWWTATQLSLIGNFVYYLALSTSIQLAGAPLPTLLVGTLPVVIAVIANRQARTANRLPWRQLVPSVLIILLGLALVNAEPIRSLQGSMDTTLQLRYAVGAFAACAAVAAWTWYPLRNSQWLSKHPSVSGATWASAQGLVTLPIALIGLAASMAWYNAQPDAGQTASLLGSTPARFLLLMLLMGLGASWLGTLLWNVASQCTPPSLTGQLIVFETVAALTYAYFVYDRPPSNLELAGITCLLGGVLVGVRQLRLAPLH